MDEHARTYFAIVVLIILFVGFIWVMFNSKEYQPPPQKPSWHVPRRPKRTSVPDYLGRAKSFFIHSMGARYKGFEEAWRSAVRVKVDRVGAVLSAGYTLPENQWHYPFKGYFRYFSIVTPPSTEYKEEIVWGKTALVLKINYPDAGVGGIVALVPVRFPLTKDILRGMAGYTKPEYSGIAKPYWLNYYIYIKKYWRTPPPYGYMVYAIMGIYNTTQFKHYIAVISQMGNAPFVSPPPNNAIWKEVTDNKTHQMVWKPNKDMNVTYYMVGIEQTLWSWYRTLNNSFDPPCIEIDGHRLPIYGAHILYELSFGLLQKNGKTLLRGSWEFNNFLMSMFYRPIIYFILNTISPYSATPQDLYWHLATTNDWIISYWDYTGNTDLTIPELLEYGGACDDYTRIDGHIAGWLLGLITEQVTGIIYYNSNNITVRNDETRTILVTLMPSSFMGRYLEERFKGKIVKPYPAPDMDGDGVNGSYVITHNIYGLVLKPKGTKKELEISIKSDFENVVAIARAPYYTPIDDWFDRMALIPYMATHLPRWLTPPWVNITIRVLGHIYASGGLLDQFVGRYGDSVYGSVTISLFDMTSKNYHNTTYPIVYGDKNIYDLMWHVITAPPNYCEVSISQTFEVLLHGFHIMYNPFPKLWRGYSWLHAGITITAPIPIDICRTFHARIRILWEVIDNMGEKQEFITLYPFIFTMKDYKQVLVLLKPYNPLIVRDPYYLVAFLDARYCVKTPVQVTITQQK